MKESICVTHPNIAKQWHPTKNGTFKAHNATKGTTRYVWWACKVADDHVWRASIYQRCRKESGCPFCSSRRVCKSNSLAFIHPKIAKEWSPKNLRSPSEYTKASGSMVWWVCSKGHEWHTKILNRTVSGSGCPQCVKLNKIANNPLNTNDNKKLLREWHPRNKLSPTDYCARSSSRVLWLCSEGHEWVAAISDRTSKKTQCPFCMHVKPSADCNTLLRPEYAHLLAEWHPTKNERCPEEFCRGSITKVWWICSKGHEWMARIHCRTTERTGCPFCKCKSHGIRLILRFLEKYKLDYQPEKTYESLRGAKRLLRYDFCVTIKKQIGPLVFSYEYLIEYDGEQHFKPIKMFGGEKTFTMIKKYDALKNKFASVHNKPLLRLNKHSNVEIELCSFLGLDVMK